MFGVSQNHELSFLSPIEAFRARETFVSLIDSTTFSPSRFSYFCYPMQSSLKADTTRMHEVLGRNDFGNPDLVS
jgi:hypothetical protein